MLQNATIAGHSDAELGETLEKQEIRPTDDVISFEDEFAQQMKGRSDTANVRRMKTHHKFNAQTKPVEDAVLDKEEIVIDWKVVDHDWQDDIELETEHSKSITKVDIKLTLYSTHEYLLQITTKIVLSLHGALVTCREDRM